MKKLIYCVLALLPAYLIIQGCNKLNDVVVTNGISTLKVQKSEVMINQPDTLLISDAKTTDKVVWTVSPTGSNTISSNGPGAVLTFSKAGSYTVTATVNDGKPLTATITVNTTVYNQPSAPTPIALTGDQINLTPSLYKNSAADSTYIIFDTRTTTSYCLNSRLNLTASNADGNYNVSFINVLPYVTCAGVSGTLRTNINFKQGPATLSNGTYPLNIALNGTTYTGSIVVSTASIIFNWNYTTGVVLTSKTITR